MGISGVSNLNNYNINLTTKDIDKEYAVKAGALAEQADKPIRISDNMTSDNSVGLVKEKSSESDVNRAPKKSDPNNFTFDFKKNNDFSLVGATNELEDIDVEKAMSDMKKETVLDKYKYFVDFTNMGTDEDGTVRPVNRG